MVMVDDEEGEFEQRLPGISTKSPSENMGGKGDKEDEEDEEDKEAEI